MGGAEDHFNGPRWSGNCPIDPKNGTYSAKLFGELALARLEARADARGRPRDGLVDVYRGSF